MIKDVYSKTFVISIVILFIGISVIPSSGTQIDNNTIIPTNLGNTLYVGGSGEGNYSSIQDAIDNASDGDTIFVYDDSSPYKESGLDIEKSINLIGENKDTTVIDGLKDGIIIIISYTDWVNISGFTIQNSSQSGIWVAFSDSINISGNIFADNRYIDIYIIDCNYNYIADNIFTNYKVETFNKKGGILLEDVSFTTILGNIITNCFVGITLWSALIAPLASNSNIISGNLLDNNSVAMQILANNTLITRNTISNHTSPYNLIIPALNLEGRNNIPSNNNFINNIRDANNVLIIFSLSEIFTARKNKNVWDGNYWGRPRLMPKFIFSYIRFERGFPKPAIPIPFYSFDWNPAKEPYDI